MVLAKSIEKSFDSLKVLKDINLNIKEGEVVAVVGPSGAGKSTLLHILGTLDSFDDGQLYLNDTEVTNMVSDDLAKFRNSNIGFVFQFHNLFPEFTALENTAMPCYIAGLKKHEADKRAEKILTLLNLEDKFHKRPSQLSGGERQRVAVARAIVNNPKILIADEPTGSLDSKNAKMLYKLFFKLKNDLNQTFIFATHDMEFASQANRVIKLKDGKITNF